MQSGMVFNIMKYSINDGPGIRTTVFLKGCPLNCWWCHNPESQSKEAVHLFYRDRCIGCGACFQACPRRALSQNGDVLEHKCTFCGECHGVCPSGSRDFSGQEMTVSQVVEEVERDVIFYDQSQGGVTFSGGEPLMQPDFLHALLMACKERDISTAVDTCGFAPKESILSLSPLIDLFLYDVKLMDDFQHRKYTGVSNTTILENLQALSHIHKNIIVRFPVIPGITDDRRNLDRLGRFVAPLNIVGIEILPYHKTGIEKYQRLNRQSPLPALESPSEGDMAQVAAKMRDANLKILRGGGNTDEGESS